MIDRQLSIKLNVIPAKAGTQVCLVKFSTAVFHRQNMQSRPKSPCVYILASDVNGTLYIGVTSDLPNRVSIHKQALLEGFTTRYGVDRLVYYEAFATMEEAIAREKRLKKWNRLWKVRLIEQMNPEWRDLFDEFAGVGDVGPGGQGSS